MGAILAAAAVWWWFPRRRPSILLVTIDTLRPDRLGIYGNRSVETPNLDRIGRDGMVFTQASATVPLTLPSHASILTGAYPFTHGVRDNGDFTLPGSLPTLAARLKSMGYDTAAFVGSYVLASRFGLNRGFDLYDDAFGSGEPRSSQLEAPERRADQVIAAAMRWLEQPRARPFFCWIHLNDPHTPYDPPEPFKTRYAGRPYDGEIGFADASLTPLLELLEREGGYEKMAVAVAGDHGESLGEHGESTHGYFVYESTLHVPLLLKVPRNQGAGSRVGRPVSLIDLAPTLLALAGEKPDGLRNFEGRDLRRLDNGDGERALLGESEYPRLNFGWSGLRSLRLANWKYIEAPVPELYDLDRDAAEAHNRFTERRDLAARMETSLRKAASAAAPVASEKLEPSALAKLRSLGYVAGAPVRPVRGAAARSADPKQKLPLYEKMVHAQGQLAEGQPAAAANSLEEVLREDPDIILAHHQLGGCYLTLNRPEAAAREFEQALRLNPRFSAARFDLGMAQLQLGQYREAAASFNKVLAETPNDYESLNYLGVALSGAGQEREAAEAFRGSIRANAAFGEAHFNLGRLRIRAGDYNAALESFQAARQAGLSSGQFHAEFGWLLAERKDTDAAIEQYRLALEANPQDAVVHNNFGFALAAKGELEAAIGEYRAALRLRPGYERARSNLAAAVKRQGETR